MLYTVHWDDCSVPVWLGDPVFEERIERFLALDLTPCVPPRPAALSVRPTDDGWAFESSLGRRTASDLDDATFLLLELLYLEFARLTRRLVVHAGACLVDGGAVLVFGGLHHGKSRLSFAAWSHGLPVLGDDRMALALDDATVRSLPKCLKLRLPDPEVPAAWRAAVPPEFAFTGRIRDDRRWILSRRLPGIVDCRKAVPLRAVVMLRRVAEGPTHLDDQTKSEALGDILPATAFATHSPMDLLRLINTITPGDSIPRLNIGPEQFDEAVALLASL